MFVSSMANHEKSKKHKENLAALKLILQEETGGIQSLSDSDGSYSVDDSTAKCDRLSDNSDTHSDTVTQGMTDMLTEDSVTLLNSYLITLLMTD